MSPAITCWPPLNDASPSGRGSFPSNPKLLTMTVPTGITHLPLSWGPFGHSAGVAAQSLTWIFFPAGMTMPRVLSALSDHSGLLTS